MHEDLSRRTDERVASDFPQTIEKAAEKGEKRP
jgi:hypothetical protein